MTDNTAASSEQSTPFEKIRQVDHEENEFWSARALMPLLEYTNWQNFEKVINKAIMACELSGQSSDEHFARAFVVITMGSGAKREVQDYHLSRYGCYLIVQNGDPAKPTIALGQTYFAVQTRRQELADQESTPQLTEDGQRLVLRNRLKAKNSDLQSSAKRSGVVSSTDFAVFQNHGYRGLYNGLTAADIRDVLPSLKAGLLPSGNAAPASRGLTASTGLFADAPACSTTSLAKRYCSPDFTSRVSCI